MFQSELKFQAGECPREAWPKMHGLNFSLGLRPKPCFDPRQNSSDVLDAGDFSAAKKSDWTIHPIGSMYGIYANIWGTLMVNVTIYGIHGSYGVVDNLLWSVNQLTPEGTTLQVFLCRRDFPWNLVCPQRPSWSLMMANKNNNGCRWLTSKLGVSGWWENWLKWIYWT